VTSGTGANVVLRGTVLAGDKIYENGAVIFEGGKENGEILYVGCDWAAEAAATDATMVDCADGVISPGLINAHDHITFNAHGKPVGHGDERFDHRHDWRRGSRGHSAVDHFGSERSRENILFAELRHMLAGTTTLAGSGGAGGFLRNIDQNSNNGGLSGISVQYETFPLGDSGGALIANGCDYGGIDNESVLDNTVYLPHVSEGIDAEARNEFVCLSGASGRDLIAPNTSIIHGIGLQANDIAAMAAEGSKLVWSPRSNIDLYGQTADVLTYRRLGVTVALGTDWIISGSMNTLRELNCADYLNTNHYDRQLSDRFLWETVTINGALALGAQDVLGSLDAGKIADIAVFDGSTRANYRAVIEAGVRDVAFVWRGGQPLLGESAGIDALLGDEASGCEALDVCADSIKICAERDTGFTLQNLEDNLGQPKRYELFYCDAPPEEPSCVPARPDEYTGMATASDADGDGIEDSADSCPAVFNPSRPLEGAQPNFDMDPDGDSCDICPVNEGEMCEMFDPNDRDGDGTPNAMDNCPNIPNMDQANMDGDDKGDLCDPCPDRENNGTAGCPATVYEVNQGMFMQGARVAITDMIVTGVGDDGFYAQLDQSSMDFTDLDYSGIYIYTPGAMTPPMRGDRVSVDAGIGSFQGGIQLVDAAVTIDGNGMSPMPTTVAQDDLVRAGSKGEAYEGLLVQISMASVADISKYDQFGEIGLASGLSVDDTLFAFAKPEVGDNYSSIVGCVSYRDFYGMSGNNGIAPRDENDLVTGPAELLGFDNATSFLEANTTGEPLPGLKVQMTSTTLADVTVNLTYTGAVSGPATIIIPQGDIEAPLSLTAAAAAGTGTVTAEYNGAMQMATVEVYDDASIRDVASISPGTANVSPGAMIDLTVAITLPAPSGGQLVDLVVTGDISAPATVMIPAGSFEAIVSVTANAAGTSGTIEASIDGGQAQTATLTLTAIPSECLIISEYVEGSSNNKAIELHNCNPNAPLDLTPFHICVISNMNTSCGNTEDLMGMIPADGTIVLCNSGLSDKSSCTLESSVTNFNGDDRLLVWKDDMANGDFDAGADTVLDAFGDYDMPPSSRLWENATYRRTCNLTPYTALDGSFDVSVYYDGSAAVDDFSHLGTKPDSTNCP
jgi:cytosine/adenosine deaminase-related metal-dependent hydrolase